MTENNLNREQQNDLDGLYKRISNHIIQNGRCVLILGPELSVNDQGIGYKTYFKSLSKDETLGINHYFDAENLFTFKDEAAAKTTREKVIDYYNSCGDPVLLELISRIKFPLIINLSPDTAINRIYNNKKIKFKPGSFAIGVSSGNNDFPEPSKSETVLYNIFGEVGIEGSIILTHKNLYDTIENLLPPKSMPINVENYLAHANCFLLLGVKFDSWYYQLVCHKLKIKEPTGQVKNLSTRNKDSGDLINMVAEKNFGLVFTKENPIQTIERIIDACQNNPEALRDKEVNDKFSLFVSYAWGDEDKKGKEVTRETPVDYLQNFSKLKELPSLHFSRDNNEVNFGDSIDSFMTLIGKGKTVIRVISDKYLMSPYCMIEAYRINQYKDEEKRVFTIVWEDAELNNIKKYQDFWKKKIDDLVDKNRMNELYSRNLINYTEIFQFLTPLFDNLRYEVRLNLKAGDFQMENSGNITITGEIEGRVTEFVQTIIDTMKIQ